MSRYKCSLSVAEPTKKCAAVEKRSRFPTMSFHASKGIRVFSEHESLLSANGELSNI